MVMNLPKTVLLYMDHILHFSKSDENLYKVRFFDENEDVCQMKLKRFYSQLGTDHPCIYIKYTYVHIICILCGNVIMENVITRRCTIRVSNFFFFENSKNVLHFLAKV